MRQLSNYRKTTNNVHVHDDDGNTLGNDTSKAKVLGKGFESLTFTFFFTLVDGIHRDSMNVTPPYSSIKHCYPHIFNRQLHIPSHYIREGEWAPSTACLLETKR